MGISPTIIIASEFPYYHYSSGSYKLLIRIESAGFPFSLRAPLLALPLHYLKRVIIQKALFRRLLIRI